LIIGNRVLGLVQLSGLNLVPKPPARIKAFIGDYHLQIAGLLFAAS